MTSNLNLYETIDLLRKHPNHPLWNKDYRKFTKEDFMCLIEETEHKVVNKKCKKIVKNTGEIYKNAFHAAKANGIDISTVSRILNGILIRRIGEYKYLNE